MLAYGQGPSCPLLRMSLQRTCMCKCPQIFARSYLHMNDVCICEYAMETPPEQQAACITLCDVFQALFCKKQNKERHSIFICILTDIKNGM